MEEVISVLSMLATFIPGAVLWKVWQIKSDFESTRVAAESNNKTLGKLERDLRELRFEIEKLNLKRGG